MANHQIPSVAQQQIIANYVAGLTLDAAANGVGYTRKAAKNALLRAGITLRSRSESQHHRRAFDFDQRYFAVINSDAKAYWLGFATADGCVMESPNAQLSFCLARRDRGHLAKFTTAIGPNCPIRHGSYSRGGKTYQTARIALLSPRLAADLTALGVVPRKSLVVQPWPGPPELMRHYWRGVFDGDGCIHRRKNGYWSIQLVGSHGIVYGFADFVFAHVGQRGKPMQRGTIFHVGYGGLGLPQLIAALLYGDAGVCLDRKKALADQLLLAKPQEQFGTAAEKLRR